MVLRQIEAETGVRGVTDGSVCYRAADLNRF
jgi:hypothetical protein